MKTNPSERMGLRGYQVEAFNAITKGFGEFQKQLAVKPTGCHAPGSPILMADGSLRAVETIRVGEQVMGPDSQPRTVMELHCGSDDMFEIDPVKGDSFAVNAGHMLRLRKTPESPLHREPVHTEISLTDYLSTSQNFRHLHKLERFGVEFPETQVAGRPLDPYFLGILIGDGCLHQKQIMVCTPDHEIIEMLVRFSQMYGVRLRRVDLTNNAADNYYFVGKEPGYDSDPIRSFVRRLGLAVKSGEKFIPDGYKRGSWEIRAELLAGLLDTDGHGSNGGYEYSSKSPTLSEDVVFVARSLGLAAYRSKKIVGCKTYYRVNISGDCSWLPLRVVRKRVEARRQIKNPLVTGFTVHPVGRGEYFGFTIGGDHLYLDGSFTVHHNSGKTILFAKLAEHYQPRRTLVLAHREELISQAVDKIRKATGLVAEVEMGGSRASLDAPVVVASVQTLMRENRRERFPRDHFGLVVVDEAHHVLANSYLSVVRHYDEYAFVLGVSATPDRGDKKNLGRYFQNIAYEISLLDLIKQQWLSPIRVKTVPLGLDLSGVRTTAGDFNPDDLAHAIEPYLGRIADVMVENRDRKTLVFLPLISLSKKFAAMCRERGLTAEHVDGQSRDRAGILARFSRNEPRILSNAMLLTEGYDEPSIDCVVCLRPTKIRALYSQIVGRGTRLFPGKDHLLLLDFLWLSGDHSLVKPAHLIAGSAEEAAQITENIGDEGDLEEAKEASDRDLEASLRKRLEENCHRQSRTFDALEFALSINDMDLADYVPTMAWHDHSVTPKQAELLARYGVDPATVSCKGQASAIIDKVFMRFDLGLATPKQVRMLQRFGHVQPALATFNEAKEFLNVHLAGRVAARHAIHTRIGK